MLINTFFVLYTPLNSNCTLILAC
uniref:Uncharacterized protein n=1 Tax=Anguilla anguilla TaxID=7936 RepID=A0A0E9RGK0_ANGAN